MRWPWRKRRAAVEIVHPPIVEHCWECGIDLCAAEEHELRAYGDDEAEIEASPSRAQGGTYVTESFCWVHCPGGCECGCLTPHIA